MEIDYLVQPDIRIGDFLQHMLDEWGLPTEIVLVSAFASLSTVFRWKSTVLAVKNGGGEAHIVLGVDLGGTSKEVLQEVAGWTACVTVVKNVKARVIFHPKICFLRWADRAELIVGSSNLTEGGFYTNYEAAVRTEFNLPTDASYLETATTKLQQFLNPQGPTASRLTTEYLAALIALPEIPSEAQARRSRGEGIAKRPDQNQPTQVFGYEPVSLPPKLPADLQQLVLAARSQQLAEHKREIVRARRDTHAVSGVRRKVSVAPQAPRPSAQIDPSAFYMTLPAMQGANNPSIPGEPRIPLEARDMAEDFWGWPDNYTTSVSPRSGTRAKVPRIYKNWRPIWRIWAADDPGSVTSAPVRMYFYENSADFRFYAGDLKRLGARSGDIVRLTRIDEADAVFECVLAREGTAEYNAWHPLLVNRVGRGNSERRFGYA